VKKIKVITSTIVLWCFASPTDHPSHAILAFICENEIDVIIWVLISSSLLQNSS
jgi:hypothetical protein